MQRVIRSFCRDDMRRAFLAVWLLCGAAIAFGAPSKKLKIAAVDFYSTASLSKAAARQLAPDTEIEWTLIQTHKYLKGWEDSLKVFEGSERWVVENPHDPQQWNALIARARAKQFDQVLGGMCEGTYWAIPLAAELGLPGNPLTSRELGRRKALQAQALGAYGIPTHVVKSARDIESAIAFVDSITHPRVVVKLNSGAGGAGYETFDRADHAGIRQRLLKRMDEPGLYGFEDSVILQPEILGDQFYVQTDTHNFQTIQVGLWSYNTVQQDGKPLPFLDRPLSLFGSVARELDPITKKILVDIFFQNGVAHIEMIREHGTGRWYVMEINPRILGAGISDLEREVWGISQLELNLLRFLNPERYHAERAKFPRRKERDGMVIILPASGEGRFSPSGAQLLASLPSYTPAAEFYMPHPDKPVRRTESLNTAAATLTFTANTSDLLRRDYRRVLQAIKTNALFEYRDPNCAQSLSQQALVASMQSFDRPEFWQLDP